MTAGVAVLVFAGCLIVTLAASEALVRGLDRLGARLGLSEGLLGLLTALGADAPEISSAIAAMHSGARDVGLGVVLGSNIFNLAALLGVGAVLAGHIRARRAGLLLDGGVALLVTLIVAAFAVHVLGPLALISLLLVVFVPYVAVLGAAPRRLTRLPLPDRLGTVLALAVSEVDHEAAEDPRVSTAAGALRLVLLVPLALVLIVAASTGMVAAALALARLWALSHLLVGDILLAVLTSLPNAYTAARLALQGRGAAVISETLNSNTINILAGMALPAIVLGAGTTAGGGGLELAWLTGMTLLALILLAGRRGLTRSGGIALVALYLIFVAVRLAFI